MRRDTRLTERGSLISVIVGGAIGGVIGAIVAVNVVIFSGAEAGYETSLPELFRWRPVIGVVVIAVLIAGPVVGALMALSRVGPPEDG